MATRIHTTVTDDLDGTPALGTYRFALEGREYENDLSEDNLARLRAALAPFIAAVRRLPNPHARGATPRPRQPVTGAPPRPDASPTPAGSHAFGRPGAATPIGEP